MRCVKTQVAAWAGAAEQSIPGSFGLHLKNKTTVECSASGAGRAAEQWGGISVSCTLSSSSVSDSVCLLHADLLIALGCLFWREMEVVV